MEIIFVFENHPEKVLQNVSHLLPDEKKCVQVVFKDGTRELYHNVKEIKFSEPYNYLSNI
jgi:hypothetical protein